MTAAAMLRATPFCGSDKMEACGKVEVPGQLEQKVITALETGTELSLADLGGPDALYGVRGKLALSPLVPEFIRISLSDLGNLTAKDQAATGSFVVFCLKEMADEFAVQEAVEVLERHRPLPPNLEQECFVAFLDSVQDSKKPALTRALCLEGAFRLTVDFPARKHQFLAYLMGISDLDEPKYLRRVAKIVGVAYSAWREPELVTILERLSEADPAMSEASFELGMAALAKAFDAEDSKASLERFATAKEQFELSLGSEEDHPEAQVYLSAIEILLAFQAKGAWQPLNTELTRLKQAVTIYQAWHCSTLNQIRAGARNIEMAHWYTLATKLEALSSHLAEPSWFAPAMVIEQTLLDCYAASRSIFRKKQSGGIEILVRPRIEGSLIKTAGQLYALWKWLEMHETEAESHFAVGELKVQLAAHLGDAVLGKASVTTLENFQSAIPGLSKLRALSPTKASILEQVMADQLHLQAGDYNPALESILESCMAGVSSIADYQKSRVRESFHTLLFQSVKYLESRMDMTRAHEPRVSFLFEPRPGQDLPVEKDLQQDYYYFVGGNISAGDIRVEMSDVSSGRADVYFSFGAIKYVAEIKRELDDSSFESLRSKYIGQAAEYQNTNVKLGFLLVLDLTEKRRGAGDIKNHVKVEVLNMTETSGRRAVVVIRVPGRRATPSDVKLIDNGSPSPKTLKSKSISKSSSRTGRRRL